MTNQDRSDCLMGVCMTHHLVMHALGACHAARNQVV